jgi:hypothetical protein
MILWSFFWKSIRLRLVQDDFSYKLGTVTIVILISTVILSITTEPMRYPSSAWYLFAIGSMVTVKYRQLKRKF